MLNTDFGIFVRQPQIRYTNGAWQFAIENPESTITPYGGSGRIVTDQNRLPDFVGRYNLTSGGLSMSFAVLARQLSYNDGTFDSNTTSSGVSVTGKAMLGQNDIRFGVNSGKGMGRYIGLNAVNGAVMDANGDLQTINETAFYTAFRLVMDTKSRMNFIASTLKVDNDVTLTGMGATKSTTSFRVNYMYSPTPKLTFGGEVSRATRKLESGDSGNMSRLEFMAKLAF